MKSDNESAEKKPEDFVKYGDGFADITLSRPLNIGGPALTKLRMREPTVGDQITHDARKGSDAEKEMETFAALMEMAPEHVRKLPLRDYRRLTAAYLGFLE
ncbi:phage tail assembly protein [Paraburkholderia sp.]|uniref:phage tail assembly protein n=1 Tax=Paraburkholderia sp. TaxID=1926495 RepID=UPI0025F83950|nr:phage tail assembly protein [Paraburkholderia sp.]